MVGSSMEVKVSIAQTNKYAVSHCGDSVDVVERWCFFSLSRWTR